MRSLVRGIALAVGGLVLAVAQALLMATGLGGSGPRGAWTVLPRLFHRFACAVLGIRLRVEGQASTAAQTVWVTNHLSYLDVAVLGSLLRCVFVAKDEVRDWPVFGAMARLQRTVFIGRRRVGATDALDTMAAALAAGFSLVLFAEGTTSDGTVVLPFKSPVFGLLRDAAPAGLMVQPVTIRLDRAGDDRAGPARHYPYVGDDVLVPHLGRFLAGRSTTVTVVFHAPIEVAELPRDRKQTARQLHAIVASGLDVAHPAAGVAT